MMRNPTNKSDRDHRRAVTLTGRGEPLLIRRPTWADAFPLVVTEFLI
jgi:hypothetical protein